MKILILGANNIVARSLIKSLTKRNDEVIVLTENIPATSKLIGAVHNIEFYNIFDQIETNINLNCVIDLKGIEIEAGKWNINRIEQLIDKRKSSIKKFKNFIDRLKYKPKKLINASAIGWYGYNPKGLKIDETFDTPSSTLAHTLYNEWEKGLLDFIKCGIKVQNMRFGTILNKSDGIIKKFSPLFKYNLGFYLGEGRQHMSWIHINDVIKAILFLIDNQTKYNIYNFTTPYPATNKEFSNLLANCFHSKLFFKIPNFITYLLLGKKGKELLLNDLQALPNHLIEEGFIFEHPTLRSAMKNLT